METGGRTMTDRRRIIEMALLLVMVAVIGGWFVARRTPPYPYKDGSSHEVTVDCNQVNGECSIHLGPSKPGRPQWTGETTAATLPPGWAGQTITGTLRIVHGWGTPSATFESGGTTVEVWGGKPDGKHGFAA